MKWIAVFKEQTGERASFQKVGDTLQIQANAPIVINATGEKLNGAVNVTINQLTSALKKLDEQLPTWSERKCGYEK